MSSQDDQPLLLELAQACERLAGAVELPARVPSYPTASPTWTFLDQLPDEALLGRVLNALSAWDPDDPQRSSASPEAALELVEFAAHARDLIERSSHSEPDAKLLQHNISPERVDEIRRMLREWRTARAPREGRS